MNTIAVSWGLGCASVNVEVNSRTTCGDVCQQLAAMKQLPSRHHVQLLRANSRSRSPLTARTLVSQETELQAVVLDAVPLHTTVPGISSTRQLFEGGAKRSSCPLRTVLWRLQTQFFVEERDIVSFSTDDHQVLRSWEQQLSDTLRSMPRYMGHMIPEENGFNGRTFVLPRSRERLRDIRADICDAFGISRRMRCHVRLERRGLHRIPDEPGSLDECVVPVVSPEDPAAKILTSFGDTFELDFGRLGLDRRSGRVCAWLSRSVDLAGHPILGVIGCLGPLTPTPSEAEVSESDGET